jgi:hypothetical protein
MQKSCDQVKEWILSDQKRKTAFVHALTISALLSVLRTPE